MSTPFDCQICFKLAAQPQACQKCGQVYCLSCLEVFWQPQHIMCTNCWSGDIKQFSSDMLALYNEIQLNSPQKPEIPKPPSQKKLEKMESETQMKTPNFDQETTPCTNYSLCRRSISTMYKQQQVCSPDCLLFIAIQNKNDPNELRSIIETSINTIRKINNTTSLDQSVLKLQQVSQPVQAQTGKFQFNKGGKNVNFSIIQVILSEEVYVFRTVTSDTPFESGIYYWEITLLNMTENEIKIGVTKEFNDLNSGFSDHPKGWAYYTIGQLRNGSNSQGKQYGLKLKNKGTIGVFLNMNKGILAFSGDNQFMGVAFQDNQLKQGPIYPAVAMLHKAGFTYQSGLVPPAIFNSVI